MASSSIVSPRVPIQAIKKLDTFNDNCYYPIRAISFLATFAMFEELPAQSIVFANGTLMNEDVKALADAEILDSRLTPRFQQIVTQYHRIVEKCVILRNTVDNVYGALPKSRKDCVLVPQDPSYHADPSYHTTFHAFSYLCIYGVTAGAAPEPTDKVVDCTAIKLIEDITKIDDEVEFANCRTMRDHTPNCRTPLMIFSHWSLTLKTRLRRCVKMFHRSSKCLSVLLLLLLHHPTRLSWVCAFGTASFWLHYMLINWYPASLLVLFFCESYCSVIDLIKSPLFLLFLLITTQVSFTMKIKSITEQYASKKKLPLLEAS